MKILFYGDSITDAGRLADWVGGYSAGFVGEIAAELLCDYPQKFEIVNTGISGNRIVDLYARAKADLWNHNPDLISILIGINDIWHELNHQNGVELDRFIKVYRMLLEDTRKKLPNAKIILCEPFVLEGSATSENYDKFLEIKEYAKEIKKIADEFDVYYLSLQSVLDKACDLAPSSYWLHDGVHPTKPGAKLIANEWIKFFKKNIFTE